MFGGLEILSSTWQDVCVCVVVGGGDGGYVEKSEILGKKPTTCWSHRITSYLRVTEIFVLTELLPYKSKLVDIARTGKAIEKALSRLSSPLHPNLLSDLASLSSVHPMSLQWVFCCTMKLWTWRTVTSIQLSLLFSKPKKEQTEWDHQPI